MRTLRFSDPQFSRELAGLNRRATPDPKVRGTVDGIISAVTQRGDRAVIDFTQKFGGPKLKPAELYVAPKEIAEALAGIPPKVERAILAARANVRAFAKRGLRKTWFMKNRQGATVGERYDAFERVGIYIPGGSAPLVSTAIMTATLAAAAGVPQIVAATPADKNGQINPALLAALSLSGATEIYRIGGAQAIAALALGTETISPVHKIFGPGNAYVVEAKRQLFGTVAVDLLPGPSEVLVIADDSANPAWIAADLLAQSEHGHGSIGLLVTTSAKILSAVEREITKQAKQSARPEALAAALEALTLVRVKDLPAAIRLANQFAAEHVAIATREPGNVAALLNSSGAIFLGGLSPVVAGDFLAGPSHTLPTGGAGKSFAGLTADQFQRRTSIIRYTESALEKSLPSLETFSEIEGLDAHGRSAAIRLKK